jgi:hypothetical protein
MGDKDLAKGKRESGPIWRDRNGRIGFQAKDFVQGYDSDLHVVILMYRN